MLAAVVGRQAAKTGPIGVDDADLVACLHFEDLADEDDLAGWLAGGY